MSTFAFSHRALSRVSFAAILIASCAADAAAQATQPLAPVTVDAPRPRATPRVAPTTARQASRRVVRRALRAPPPVAAAPVVPTQPAAVAGPTPIDRDPAGGGLNPNGLNLTKIAPTGSRLGLTPFETPASVEIVPGQVARDRGQRTVQEAVSQDATGFTFIGSPGNGGTALSVRGFAGHNSTQQLFDGTRLYVASGTVTFPYDTWSAERIEVLRGPASVLYGEGSIGGIINVIPKKPTPFFTHEGFAAVGSDQSRRIAVGSGGPINDWISYRVDVAGNAAKSWLTDNNDYRNYDFATSIKVQPTADFQTTITNDYGVNLPLKYFGTPLIRSTTGTNGTNGYNGGFINPALRFVNYNVGNSTIKYQDNFTQVKSEWNPLPGLTFRNTAYRLTSVRHYYEAEQYFLGPTPSRITRGTYLEIYHNEEQIGDRFDITGDFMIGAWKNKVLVGGEVNQIRFRHTNNSSVIANTFTSTTDLYNTFPNTFQSSRPTVLGFQSKAETGALFAENQLKPFDWLSIIGGVRYDSPKIHREDYFAGTEYDKQYRQATWHAGAVVNPFPWLSLYTQYATGVDSVGNVLTTSFAQAPFSLSRGRQIEAGAKASAFDGRIESTLAFYYILKKDLLTPDPNAPATQSVQVGAQSSRGVELSIAAWVIPDVFRIDFGGAILRAKYDDFRQTYANALGNGKTIFVNYSGFVPVNVPQQVVNLWGTWRFAPQWEARVGMQYVGKTYSDFINFTVRPKYAVLNGSIDYKATDNIKFSLRGFNLTNTIYAQSSPYTTQFLLGQPRRFELALNVRY